MNVLIAVFAVGFGWMIGAYVTYTVSARAMDSDMIGAAMGIFFPFSLVIVLCFYLAIPLLKYSSDSGSE